MATSKNKKNKSKQIQKAEQQQQVIPEADAPAKESEEALKSDLLDDFLFHAANYIYIRRKLFITLAVIVIAAICATWGTFKFIEYRENIRNERLYQIERVIYDTSLSDAEREKNALPLLHDFLEEFNGSDQATLALFYRAGLHFSQKEYSKAEEDLDELLSQLEPGSDLFFLASLNLANVLRDQNKTERAVEVLQSAKVEAMTDIILMEQAETFMSIDQKEKAKELLQVLLKDYPGSYYATKAKQLLEIL